MEVNHTNRFFPFELAGLRFFICVFFVCLSQIGVSKETIEKLSADAAPGKIGNLSHTETVDVFEILTEAEAITIQKGSSGNMPLTINRATDFTGAVNLLIFPSPGLPTGVTAPFTPSTVPGDSSSSILTLQIGETATSGTYNIAVAGTGSRDGTTYLRRTTIVLTITDPQPPGVVASFNFLDGDNPISGFDNINSNITLDVQDLPDVVNFSANTIGAVTAVEWIFREQGSATNIQTYTDNASPYTLYPSGGWTVSTGVYELQAVQINNSERGDAKTIIITIESAPPPSFNLSANPSSLTIFQGEVKSTEIKLSPVNNFSGQVDLLTDDLPEGVQGFFSIITLDTEGTTNLTFEVDERAPVGSYSVRVLAMGPNEISSNIIIDLNINRASLADFELSANQNNLNIIRGETGKVNLTVKPINGFNQTVNFEAIASDNTIDFQFSPSEIVNGNGLTEMTIFTNEDLDLGTIEVNVFATADTLEKSVNLSLVIAPVPIVLKPKNQFSPNGDGIDDVWEIDQILELSDHTVMVFDRLGKEVFKAQPYKNDWDGKNQNGMDLQPTTYFYTIKDAAGNVVNTGSINLLR